MPGLPPPHLHAAFRSLGQLLSSRAGMRDHVAGYPPTDPIVLECWCQDRRAGNVFAGDRCQGVVTIPDLLLRISAAVIKNLAPSPSKWSLNWIGERGSGLISFRRSALRSRSGQPRKSLPLRWGRSKAKNTIDAAQ
jgi:hypothetical protein